MCVSDDRDTKTNKGKGYYKDNKTLLHPQGVIDLNDSTVRLVSNETIKKKNCFEIVTPSRTYYVCGKNDEEVFTFGDLCKVLGTRLDQSNRCSKS